MTGSRAFHPAPPASTPGLSTTQVATGQASQVVGGAADAAQHVAGVAKEQAGQVAAAAGQQVKQLAGQAQSELVGQAKAQQAKLAGGLHSVGDQLKSMATSSEQQGVATDLAHQVAEKAHQFAGWLDDHEPADLLAELRTFARRKPGSFLAAALAAGAAAGRLARGMSVDPAAPAMQSKPSTTSPAVGSIASPPALTAPAPMDPVNRQ